MIPPGFVSAHIGATGSVFDNVGATSAISPAIYSSGQDVFFHAESKGNTLRYSTFANIYAGGAKTTWSTGASFGSAVYGNTKVSYENGWVFVPNANATNGSGVIHYSTNVTSGTLTTTNILDNSPRFVIWQPAANRWLAGGAAGTWATATGTSSLTWTRQNASGTQTHLNAATDGTNVLAIGSGSTLRLFGTGTTGTAESTTGLSGTYADIAYANGMWVIVGSSGLCAYKTTLGSSWTVQNIGFGTGSISGIGFYGNRWYASGNDSNNGGLATIRRSADQNITSNWTNVYTSATVTSAPTEIRSANNKLVSVAISTSCFIAL